MKASAAPIRADWPVPQDPSRRPARDSQSSGGKRIVTVEQLLEAAKRDPRWAYAEVCARTWITEDFGEPSVAVAAAMKDAIRIAHDLLTAEEEA